MTVLISKLGPEAEDAIRRIPGAYDPELADERLSTELLLHCCATHPIWRGVSPEFTIRRYRTSQEEWRWEVRVTIGGRALDSKGSAPTLGHAATAALEAMNAAFHEDLAAKLSDIRALTGATYVPADPEATP